MFCEKTRAVPLCLGHHELRKPFTVHILNRNGEWVKGSEKILNADALKVWVVAEKQIERGVSGGPIINQSGKLLGIVSVSSNQIQSPHGKS
jgi:hypothetical protein